MFNLISNWGEHSIYTYDTKEHEFIKYFKNLYNEEDLEQLYLKSKDYKLLQDNLNSGSQQNSIVDEINADLHVKFYNDIKKNNSFKKLYCKFIKDIYKKFFPDEKYMIFQSFPCVRFQFMNSVTIPPHKDSDELSNHPLGEKIF